MEKATSHPTNLQGFALVVALSLMSFVLLLLLSITTLVKVETNVADTQMSTVAAKQNALLALNVAIGELQAATGPDQRVTARADILDSTPATLADDDIVNPYWVAAYKTVETGKETQPLEALRRWATDKTAIDRIDWLVSSRTPLDGTVNPATTDVETLNGGQENVVTLATYNNNQDQESSVRAGKVDILDKSTEASGRYAWWVADESAKFRINAIKEETVLDGQNLEPEWSLMAPQQSNPSIISDLSSFDVKNIDQREKIGRSLSANSLPLIDPSWEAWTEENGNDYTFFSKSIPVDVTQGRLKEDLAVYLETDASGLSDSDNIIRGSSTDQADHYTGRLSDLSSSLNYNDDKLPKFGLIKSWYETGTEIEGFAGGTAQTPRPQKDDEHGLHPVLMRGSVNFGLSYKVSGTGFIPVFLIYPKFVLWNPHNVPIAPSKYAIQVRVDASTLITHIAAQGKLWAAYNETQDFYYPGHFSTGGHTFSKFTWTRTSPQSLARNPSDSKYQTDSDDTYTYLTFVIDNEGFAPGESLYYTASDKLDPSDINSNAYVNEDISFLESNYSESDFADHNLLINEEEGVFGYFHHSAEKVNLPEPDLSSPPPVTPRTTAETDVLRAALIFEHDRRTDTHPADLSLSTKLYAVSNSGNIELLQFLDFFDGDNIKSPDSIDWEHRDIEGHSVNPRLHYSYVDFQSLSSITQGASTPDFIRGHGFTITPTGIDVAQTAQGNDISRKRLLARNSIAVSNIDLVDPLLSSSEPSALYTETKHTRDEFDSGVGFPAGIPSLDGEYDSISADGYDTLGGYGLHSSAFVDITPGNTVYPLYDYPRSETSLLSLGFLKNVNFSQFHWQPSFAFGNSEAHTHIARESFEETHGDTQYYDLSYLLNESLWDRFFVSSIPQTGGSLDAETKLPNGRNQLVPNADGTFPDDSDLRNSKKAFEQVASNVMVNGAFNVNSTSVDAWRMFLASQLGESVQTASGADSNSFDNAPTTSRAFPILPENGSIDTSAPQTWSALRSLSPDEINALAEAMVEEVKLRGPFLSMADFVNRRLVPDANIEDEDYLGLKGTLQSAIDKVSTSSRSYINEPFYQNNTEITSSSAPPNTSYPEHERGMPGEQSGSTMFGAPGFYTQADVLAGLGSLMTVRGDTFTIRTYGESLSGITGAVESKAWCEAIVQRIATPVESGDSMIKPTGKFGRQYKIVSVRWLNERELL